MGTSPEGSTAWSSHQLNRRAAGFWFHCKPIPTLHHCDPTTCQPTRWDLSENRVHNWAKHREDTSDQAGLSSIKRKRWFYLLTICVIRVYVRAGDVPPLYCWIDSTTKTLLTTRGHSQWEHRPTAATETTGSEDLWCNSVAYIIVDKGGHKKWLDKLKMIRMSMLVKANYQTKWYFNNIYF